VALLRALDGLVARTRGKGTHTKNMVPGEASRLTRHRCAKPRLLNGGAEAFSAGGDGGTRLPEHPVRAELAGYNSHTRRAADRLTGRHL